MKVKIKPNRLDGIINEKGVVADYILASNSFGNRVRVVDANQSISKLLLTFNAKGTKFDLTDKEWLVPIISVCSLFAFSNTEISGVESYKHTVELINALNDIGGKVEYKGNIIYINGIAGIEGGSAKTNNKDILFALMLAGSCAFSKVEIDYTGRGSIEDLLSIFKSLGGIVE